MKEHLTTLAEPQVGQGTAQTESVSDRFRYLGYVMLAASLSLFVLFDVAGNTRDDAFAAFVAHYVLAVVYSVFLIVDRAYGIRKSWREANLARNIVLINLFLVAAFSLNRQFAIFQESAHWFAGYLVLASATLMSFQFFDRLPKWFNCVQFALLGSSFVFYLYASLYMLPYYPFGLIGLLFLGMGALVMVPFTLMTASIFVFKYHFKKSNTAVAWVIGGIVAPLLFTAGFITEWSRRVNEIEKIANRSVIYRDAELPAWIKVGQSLPNDGMTQRILKSDLVYTTASRRAGSFNRFPDSWEESLKHDPLVLLSTYFAECTLSNEDRINVLHALATTSHRISDRLWSGDDLSTSYVVSDVDIYPELRLAYTEKYLNIKNHSGNQWRDEEAIYTFQLPEGSVVTSLSLWVNGKEEKGILTSKQKAAEAYETIVGVEQRDPSVIHWQEGNTVTVRVFPCTTAEERKFKIGVTSPLATQDGQIVYRNILFQGPNTAQAKETMRVRFIGNTELELPRKFKKDRNGDYVADGDYDPEFNLEMKEVSLKPDSRFTFDGFQYSLQPYKPTHQPFKAKQIYLDINNSWSDDELETLKSVASQRNVFVFHDDDFLKLDAQNWDVAKQLQTRNFTLFPFHLLKNVEDNLVVTKGKPLSPHLRDVQESEFGVRLRSFFAAGNKVHVYNLGSEVSTYVRSLREFRSLQFAEGTPKQLLSLLEEDRFPETLETANTIVLHDAGICITRTAVDAPLSKNTAPDHLARLFTYNDIMRRVGTGYFNDSYQNDALVADAAKAYVVTPVSSLIVLETQQDYERFGIKDTKNSLHNASKDSSGAVPEPHEWALIILFVLFVAYLKFRA